MFETLGTENFPKLIIYTDEPFVYTVEDHISLFRRTKTHMKGKDCDLTY